MITEFGLNPHQVQHAVRLTTRHMRHLIAQKELLEDPYCILERIICIGESGIVLVSMPSKERLCFCKADSGVFLMLPKAFTIAQSVALFALEMLFRIAMK